MKGIIGKEKILTRPIEKMWIFKYFPKKATVDPGIRKMPTDLDTNTLQFNHQGIRDS